MTTTTNAARFVTTHSILSLDARHPYTAKSLIDAQAMHRTVMCGFYGWVDTDQPDPRAQLGVLSTWSLDLKNNALVLVVQSRVAPDWSNIPHAAHRREPKALTVDMTIREGDTYAFRTVVNPTSNRPAPTAANDGKRARGRRIPHATPRHVTQWFTDRLQPPGESSTGPRGIPRIGATANQEQLSVRMLPTVSSTGSRTGLRIARAEIKGTLTVTDPTTLTRTLAEGIGRGRAYSTGLLLVRGTQP
ncbi:type I-E CRISPR-associated protein Cas6/Cse3/CasE [Streptomyces sp. NPDC004647]|uniref:type I-E CRISPR-associated protein Cas6/Cse3/CasE n=1 Tax=Streptomyces sp. NPDC004647 TaxID=3154671 RepID=UPI0033A05793